MSKPFKEKLIEAGLAEDDIDQCWKRLVGMKLDKLIPRVERPEEGASEELKLHAPSFTLEDGELVELVANSSLPRFLSYNPQTGATQTSDEIPLDQIHIEDLPYEIPVTDKEITITPPPGTAVKEGAILLPTGIEDYGTVPTLIEEIRQHIHRYLDIPPENETFAAWYILLTYVYDQLPTLCYFRVMGDTGTGKSRFLDVIGRLCYHATLVSGAITPAPIYRMIRTWRGTIVLDEADFRKSDEKNEVVTILNCGFEKGRPVIRCQKEDPDNLQILPTYGPKVISTRGSWKDKALESRCLTTRIVETDRDDIPDVLPTAFYKEEEKLRNKLLKYRLDMHGKIDPDTIGSVEMPGIERRIRQATASFAALFQDDEDLKRRFKEFLEKYNEELIRERYDTYEGKIMNGILQLVNAGVEVISAKDIGDSILVKMSEAEKKKWTPTPTSVGRRLKSLGFPKSEVFKVEGESKRGFRVSDCMDLIRRLTRRYVPTDAYSDKVTLLQVLHFTQERQGGLTEYSDLGESDKNSETGPDTRNKCNRRRGVTDGSYREGVADSLVEWVREQGNVDALEMIGFLEDQGLSEDEAVKVIDGVTNRKSGGIYEPMPGRWAAS